MTAYITWGIIYYISSMINSFLSITTIKSLSVRDKLQYEIVCCQVRLGHGLPGRSAVRHGGSGKWTTQWRREGQATGDDEIVRSERADPFINSNPYK